MVIQNPGTIGKRVKKGSEVAPFAQSSERATLLNLAVLQLKRSDCMRFETNQSGTEKQKLKKLQGEDKITTKSSDSNTAN